MKTRKPIPIYFADLTHTGQGAAANSLPLGISLVAASVEEEFPDLFDISLFKYPERLSTALEDGLPALIGFSNYQWNEALASAYARRIRSRHPEVVIVFGGPNYPLEEDERHEHLGRLSHVDFYVKKEGERAMVNLLNVLLEHDFQVERIKKNRVVVPSCDYVRGGELISGDLLPRIKSLGELPSPYTTGLLDQFFDGTLIPMLQTNRGCPFTCTFCTEGQEYFGKVSKSSAERIQEDLRYMAERVGSVPDLILVDSNFGMFKEDLETCRELSRLQEKHNWPKHIYVSTGKNNHERVLDAAAIVKGAMTLSATLQSSDAGVLNNIKRSNISIDQLLKVATEARSIQSNSVSEIILCLPGDSRAKHFKSLKDVVDVGVTVVRSYQLMMLPGTEIDGEASREQFGMQTKHRVTARCFGQYELWGERFPCAEIDEICVGLNTMSFEDYLDCREMGLTMEMMNNSNVFKEIFGLLQHFGLSWFDCLLKAHESCHSTCQKLADLYNDFRKETRAQLWDDRQGLEKFVGEPGKIEKYLKGDLGSNVIFKFRSIAFFSMLDSVQEVVFESARDMLEESGFLDMTLSLYLHELKTYSRLRKGNVLDTSCCHREAFHFDFPGLLEKDFESDPRDFLLSAPREVLFEHDPDQIAMIEGYVRQYGTSRNGLGRILHRAPVQRFFRKVKVPETGERPLTGSRRSPSSAPTSRTDRKPPMALRSGRAPI